MRSAKRNEAHKNVPLSDRAQSIPPSTIRGSMKETAAATASGEVVNLAQGLPEFPAPDAFKLAAIKAIVDNRNQYCNTWGHIPFREAIAEKYARFHGCKFSADTEITVTCGVSEAVNAALLTILNPGDEVILFEPFYENYRPNSLIALGVPKFVRLHAPSFTFNRAELARAFNKRTKAIIINNPNNPTSRVFTRDELEYIASLCQKWGVIAICDDIYEHMVYDGRKHIVMATIPGMEDRTFTCSGLSKTYNLTGWRVGWVIAPPAYTSALRNLHDYLTLSAPTPFQYAGVEALNSPQSFYDELISSHTALRNRLAGYLQQAGFEFLMPEGSYFLFADSSPFGFKNDKEMAAFLTNDVKVIGVPGFAFHRPHKRTNFIRFCFAKYPETIDRAGERLLALKKC